MENAPPLRSLAGWPAPGMTGTSQPHAAALSNASGVKRSRWLWRRLIVERLDIVEDVGSGEISRLVDAFLDALLLHSAEE